MQIKKVKGFLDSHIKLRSFIKLSPPRIRSASRMVCLRLASTLQRKTFAISLKASYEFIRLSEPVRIDEREVTHQKVEPKREVEDRNDDIEFYLVLVFNRALILIYLQSQDRANDNGDGKDKTERLLPEKLPCLLDGFKGPRVGILV